MAKYLRPRRGTKTNAVGQNILLKRGEIFLEFQGDTIGNSRGKLIVGDGATSYSNINSFIEDTSLYIPKYTEYSSLSSTEAINMIGDGSSTATATLPSIVAATKQALKKIADVSNNNYNTATSKANTNWFSSTNNGLCLPLENNTSRYLRADAQWREPPNDNTTYAVADFENAGLLPTLNGSSDLFLRASRTWAALPPTTASIFNTTAVFPFSGYSSTAPASEKTIHQCYQEINNVWFWGENVSTSATVPAGSYKLVQFNKSYSGWTMLGIFGFNTGNQNVVLDGINGQSENSFYVWNLTNSAITTTITAQILYTKNYNTT